jgi:hypothetical protein
MTLRTDVQSDIHNIWIKLFLNLYLLDLWLMQDIPSVSRGISSYMLPNLMPFILLLWKAFFN